MNGALPIEVLEDETLKEVYLIVRPEEKYDLEQALQTVIAPIYCTMSGLGRGGRGGLSYGSPAKKGPFRWLRGPDLSVLLPKIVFYLVIPESRVDAVIRVVSSVLRAKGGPSDCGLGVAIVGKVEADYPVSPASRLPGSRTPSPSPSPVREGST